MTDLIQILTLNFNRWCISLMLAAEQRQPKQRNKGNNLVFKYRGWKACLCSPHIHLHNKQLYSGRKETLVLEKQDNFANAHTNVSTRRHETRKTSPTCSDPVQKASDQTTTCDSTLRWAAYKNKLYVTKWTWWRRRWVSFSSHTTWTLLRSVLHQTAQSSVLKQQRRRTDAEVLQSQWW